MLTIIWYTYCEYKSLLMKHIRLTFGSGDRAVGRIAALCSMGLEVMMKYAADFRKLAREALKGHWGIAVLAGLVASLLGAVDFGGPELNIHIDNGRFSMGLNIAGQTVVSTDGWHPVLTGVLPWAIGISAAVTVGLLILGSVIKLGYARFNLDLIDRQEQPQTGKLFSYFPWFTTAVAAQLWQTLFVFLWSLLLVIPGIIASYSYAMTQYILAENPELSAREAIARSKQLMYGNRGRLFCLHLSFIGWGILCAFTFGIGNLWLTPYAQAAEAAFYREITHQTPDGNYGEAR